MEQPRWQRILLKVSGEALDDPSGENSVNDEMAYQIAEEVARVGQEFGCQIAIVVGGGNIWRGAKGKAAGMDDTDADHMGMLATVINALALKDALKNQGQNPRVMTAINMDRIAEPYIRGRAVRHLEKGRVVIFAAGTGNPHFTTDTAAALRGREINADVLLKGTHGTVDGVYTADPKVDPRATKYDSISFKEVFDLNLKVMDKTATTMCEEAELPIYVFNIMQPGNIQAVIAGEEIGTLVHS